MKDVNVQAEALIKLNGTDPTSSFVINVHGNFSVNGGGRIKGAGTVGPSKILCTVIGTGTAIGMTGSSEIDGTLTAIQRDIGCDPCLVNGQICGGRNVTMSSGAVCAP